MHQKKEVSYDEEETEQPDSSLLVKIKKQNNAQPEEQCLKVAERLVCEKFAAVLHTTPEVIKEQLCTAIEPKQITA